MNQDRAKEQRTQILGIGEWSNPCIAVYSDNSDPEELEEVFRVIEDAGLNPVHVQVEASIAPWIDDARGHPVWGPGRISRALQLAGRPRSTSIDTQATSRD